jgi:hypothetical protein
MISVNHSDEIGNIDKIKLNIDDVKGYRQLPHPFLTRVAEREQEDVERHLYSL